MSDGPSGVLSAAEVAVLATQPLYKAILDGAMDAVVTIDHHGLVQEWNAAAESMFGYSAADARGRELAALIVPAALRPRHRAGLHRLASGAMPTILDRRVELTGQRADGSTFPVELTVTRVYSTTGILYCGFLRDISDRRRMLDDLTNSRTRLVTVSDEARRRVERDLHDGAQQQLVALAIALRQVRSTLTRDPELAGHHLDRAQHMLADAITELRELARGIHSAALTEHGLAQALFELGRRSAIPVDIEAGLTERFPLPIETTAYYVIAESITNAAKHGASSARVMVEPAGNGARRSLVVLISDDGPGGADPARGSGLTGLADRVAAVTGSWRVESPPGGGTTVIAELPAPDLG